VAKRLRSSQFAIDEQLPVVHDRLHMLVYLTRMLADVASQVQRIHLTCLRAQVQYMTHNQRQMNTKYVFTHHQFKNQLVLACYFHVCEFVEDL